jgi:photosystem II stability/assembly factor-like uncharacterized protein
MRPNTSSYIFSYTILVVSSFLLISISFKSPSTTIQAPFNGLETGAKSALGYFGSVRSYPNDQIPKKGFFEAYQRSKQKRLSNNLFWEAIGPNNVGGRTLALAIDPSNPEIVFAGSASGGLWKSTSGGAGLNAWEYVRTGFPVLGVGAIAIDPQNSQTMFIGTGENYGSSESFPGIGSVRTTRGSYGIGILKSTDGGITWKKSLDWQLDQRTAVQKILVNPKRSNSVWAATTEGTYRSYDGGQNWDKVLDVIMATDIVMNPQDTSIIFIANGGMGSLDHGIYRSTNGGGSFTKMNLFASGGPSTFFGKAVLDMSRSDPNIVIASVGNSDGTLGSGELHKTWLMRTENSGNTWSVESTLDYSRVQGWYAHTAVIHPTNPQLIWAAGQPFTVYRSSNGGGNLSPIYMGDINQTAVYPALTNWADYHDIIFHPTNPYIIYFINDGGIFRTTDGGNTFENCNSGYQTTQFYNGVSNSDTNGELFLGGLQDNNSVIYEGDKNWRRGWAGDGSWTALDQTNNNNAVLSAQFGQAVITNDLFTESSFGDDNFRPTFDQLPTTETNFITPLILSPANNTTFYMGGTKIFTTELGNYTWESITPDNSLDGNPMIAMAGSHQNSEVLYVGTLPKNFTAPRPGLFRTDNKGLSWVNITGNLPNRIPTDIAVDPSNDQNVLITFGGFGSSHVFRSENGGEDWIDISSGLPDIPFWSVVVDPLNSEHIYVGNEIGVFQSKDNGSTWLNISGNLPDAVFAMDLVISRSNRFLRLATHGNGVYQLELNTAVSIKEDEKNLIPDTFDLKQNYPNPFNPTTTISYSLATSSFVQLDIFDINGKKIASLVNKTQSGGNHSVSFDGSNLSSGTYIYRLEADGKVITKKMTLIK